MKNNSTNDQAGMGEFRFGEDSSRRISGKIQRVVGLAAFTALSLVVAEKNDIPLVGSVPNTLEAISDALLGSQGAWLPSDVPLLEGDPGVTCSEGSVDPGQGAHQAAARANKGLGYPVDDLRDIKDAISPEDERVITGDPRGSTINVCLDENNKTVHVTLLR